MLFKFSLIFEKVFQVQESGTQLYEQLPSCAQFVRQHDETFVKYARLSTPKRAVLIEILHNNKYLDIIHVLHGERYLVSTSGSPRVW